MGAKNEDGKQLTWKRAAKKHHFNVIRSMRMSNTNGEPPPNSFVRGKYTCINLTQKTSETIYGL